VGERPGGAGGLRGALLVAGTTSDAGKSAMVAGICRWLARRGVAVAPFKAQNMSNNSVVTADGGEIGRAQAMQAHACGLAPSVAFNPVLLKPGSDRSSQVVVLGRTQGTVSARSYRERKAALLDVVTDTLADLRSRFDVVVCEGAGSPAEINLRATDIANMGLAQAADLPVVVVGDIDRGGVLAHLFGTVAVLGAEDQARIAGFVVNKFRGDPALLAPGLVRLRALTGRPTFGVVPWADRLWLDAEDSLSAVTDGVLGRPAPPHGSQWLRVAVVRLPRISNATDAEALACEPGVAVRYVTEPSRLDGADLVVLPGSKATVSDLAWLRATGLADAVVAHARAGRPVLGICGGYQMLGRRIADPRGVEVPHPDQHDADGLGLLDLEVEFAADKVLATPVGTAWGVPVRGYEIHHGRVVRSGDPALLAADGGSAADGEGSDAGVVLGTHWHGLLENDRFRRALLQRVAAQAGRTGFRAAPDTSFAAERAAQLDLLGDLVETHLDTAALEHVIGHGPDRDLPTVTSSLAGSAP
jgi:adenosylcobyric acid synthase